MPTARKSLVDAVASEQLDRLTGIIQEQNSRNPSVVLNEVVAELDRKQREKFWVKTCSIATKATEHLSRIANNDETLTEDSKLHSDVILSLTSLIVAVIKGETVPVDGILPIVRNLHDSFAKFDNDILQNRVSLMCELWWSKELPGRDDVTRNILLYLLRRSTRTKALKTDVHRVYAMRKCLSESRMYLDDDVNSLLLECVTSALYLNNVEGRKMIAHIFTLSEEHVTMFFDAVKVKLSESGSIVAPRYGEAYLLAWESEPRETIRERLEEDCIQPFMHHCVHAASKRFSSILQKLLAVFHARSKPDVQKMLHTLYQPILWRALKATNPVVRYNAASLLFASFPLEDPDANVVTKDADMQKKLNLIEELLFDHSPDVREVTILGICKICSDYWELIPRSVTRNFLEYLVEEFAFDVSSKSVRLAVFRGISVLLENPLSHPFLKAVIPKLGACLHDSAESVRLRFLDLLLNVKNLRTIKFWDVVEPQDLLETLANDKGLVGRRIVKLLMNSYHPTIREDDELLSRSINLLETNRKAARNFYALLHHYLDLENIVHFLLLVNRLLHLHVQSALRTAVALGDEQEMFVDPYASDSDGAGDDDGGSNLADETVAALLEIVCILWVSVRAELAQKQNADLKKKLDIKCSKSMSKFFKFFKGSEAFDSLLYMSSLLPPSVVSMSVGYCLSRLRALKHSSSEQNYAILLEAVCSWGRADDVLELMCDWLRAALLIPETPASKNKKTRIAKSVRFQDVHDPQPRLSLCMLDTMLRRPSCRKVILKHNRQSLNELLVELARVQNMLKEVLGSAVVANEHVTADFLSEAFNSYCQLAIALHSDNGASSAEGQTGTIADIIEWVERFVVPRVAEQEPDVTPSPPENNGRVRRKRSRLSKNREDDSIAVDCDPLLAWNIVKSTSTMLVNVLAMAKLDMDLISHIANFFASLLTLCIPCQRKEGILLLQEVMLALLRLQDSCRTTFRGQQGSVILETTLPTMFGASLKIVTKCCQKFEDEATTLLQSIRPVIKDILGTYRTCADSSHKQALKTIMASIMTSTLSDITGYLSLDNEDVDEEEDQNDDTDHLAVSIPSQCSFWLKMVATNKLYFKLYTDELLRCLRLCSQDDARNLFSSLVIYSVLRKEKLSCADLKDGIMVIEELIKSVTHQSHNDNGTRIDDVHLRKSSIAMQQLKKSLMIL